MKAKAPEKIYVKITHPISDEYTEMIAFEDGDGIEYTRTDVFFKMVSGWLKECATFTDMNGKKRIDEEMYKATVEDFKNYEKRVMI